MIIIIRRLIANRMVNKDAAIMKVLEMFKENEHSKNYTLKLH